MAQEMFKYCSISYLPAGPDESMPPKERITGESAGVIYIHFSESLSQAEWEESFQYKRAESICARIKALPLIKNVYWDQDYIATRFSDEFRVQDVLSKIGAILRDEEYDFDREDNEQTKIEIEKLISAVTKDNYQEMLKKGQSILDSRIEKENARHRATPALQARQGIGNGLEVFATPEVIGARVKEMEARLDRFMRDGGLALRDVKSITENPDSYVRDITYRFPYEEFLVIISINWQPSQEPLGNPIPVIFAELLISEIPDEQAKDFCDTILRMNKRLSIPLKLSWIYDRSFGLVARWHLTSIDPNYQDQCLRAMLPIASEMYRELNERFQLPTWKKLCDARERRPS